MKSKTGQSICLETVRAWCVDANAPYRLMKSASISPMLAKFPTDFFAANVALAVFLRWKVNLSHGTVPIRFRGRYGGEPSVRLGKIGDKASELVKQLRDLSLGIEAGLFATQVVSPT